MCAHAGRRSVVSCIEVRVISNYYGGMIIYAI